MTPCKSPAKCGVIKHRAGTIAKCLNGPAKSSLGSTAALALPPVPATGKNTKELEWATPEFTEVQEFPFDEDAIFDLTHGDCWYLAQVLHERTGLPYVFIYDEHDEVQHVGVELPGEKVVDIEGVMEKHEWGNKWYDELDQAGIYGAHAESFYEGDKLPKPLRKYDPEIGNFAYGEDDMKLSDIATNIMKWVQHN